MRVVLAAGLASSLVGACVVSSDDDAGDGGQVCAPGDTQTCECTNGDTGSRTCTASGRGYGSCSCDGGAGGSASVGAGGMAGATGGTAGTGSGGMQAEGGAATAGGAGGEPSMGAGGLGEGGAQQGGASGAGGGGADTTDFITPCDACASELDSCMSEYNSCLGEDICFGTGDDAGEYGCMLECIQAVRRDDDADFISTTEMADCADFCQSGGSSGWSAGLDGTTRDLFDCLAGGEVVPASPWDAPAATNCTAECFGAGT